MEEFVGKIWHNFVTSRARKNYPEARVTLDEVRRTAGIFFRALGGEGGLRVENATDSEIYARRTIMQRIAGTGKSTQYAWRDEETLRLPDSIALFPERQLNRDLYLWLTALSVVADAPPTTGKNWISQNQYHTHQTLQIWPGLNSRYQKLLAAHLQQRPEPETLPDKEAQQEKAIRLALFEPTQTVELEYAKYPPQPVTLWLHPSPPAQEFNMGAAPADQDLPEEKDEEENKKFHKKQKKRKKAEYTDMPDGKKGLMHFGFEAMWSWGEYIKLDRATDEEDEKDAARTAEDMDSITLAQDNKSSASKIKLDLDLPAEQYDDIVLSEGIAIDEWDYQQQQLQKDHCRLQQMISRHAKPMQLPARLRQQAHKVRRQFEALRPERHWLNRQNEGSELDLESYITFLTDRKHGEVNSDTPVYRDIRNVDRDLSCLLLADLSLSTEAYVNNQARVIDVIRDSLYLFTEALSATGDRFALHGFSSRNRNHIRFYNIKSFDDSNDDTVRGNINAISPGYYTRMGAAIRYATQLLLKETSSQKLLLILTDGKPNDIDKYEGRYGIEDTRQAILEAEKAGLRPFCVTIDEQAEDYLPYLFGSRSFVLIRNAEELPKKLPLLYLRLTNH